jgi:hypothetical protein
MKSLKLLALSLTIAAMLSVIPAQAVKPTPNLASAQNVLWNLSAAVMPAPPYGSGDIPGSDTASKLIVNQPNGNTEVTITGVMKELDPLTTYTVFLSNSYIPYVFTGWNVAGNYMVDVEWEGGHYPEPMVLTQTGEDITGVSLGGPPSPYLQFTVYDGTVIGTEVNIFANLGGLIVHMEGDIASDGSMSGDWHDEPLTGSRTGEWATTNGNADKTHTGDDYWTDLFTTKIPEFTFTTDEYGAGSWHINLKEDLGLEGSKTLSVWINGPSGTMLISNNFTVVFE